MVKRIIIFIFVVVSISPFLYAQQDVQISQYMFNKLLYNPGYAGSNGNICGSLLYRKQWAGFGGEPTSFYAAGDYLLFDVHGIGLKIIKDDLGNTSNLGIHLAYAYQYPLTIPGLGTGRLGVGLEFGIYQKSVTNSWRAVDDFTTDNSIPNNATGNLDFDLGLGVYYNIPKKLYFGFSTTHLLEPSSLTTLNDQSSFSTQLKRHYFVTAGYSWDIKSDGMWVLKPATLIKTDVSSFTFDFSALVHYNDKFHGGLGYRLQDAVTIIGGLKIKKNIFLSASYDITTSSLSKVSYGGPEVMLKYCRSIVKQVKKQSYKSVIFL